MNYRSLFSEEMLEQMISENYIHRRKHPVYDLWILNYSSRAQTTWMWNEVTSNCRGLVIDAEGEIKARPFTKFFEMDQLKELPSGPFEVTEKMDGSLIVAFVYKTTDGVKDIVVSTRGSFESPQALTALMFLNVKYPLQMSQMCEGFTYVFEIIYPENRIVVDYNRKEELVLLAQINTKTGEETSLKLLADNHKTGFPLVRCIDHSWSGELSLIKKMELDNAEGFVARSLKTGERVKIKFDEYKKRHRLISTVNEKRIWETLRDGNLSWFDEITKSALARWTEFTQKVKIDLQEKHKVIMEEAKSAFNEALIGAAGQTELAMRIQKISKYPSVTFALRDGNIKKAERNAWNYLRPEKVTQFSSLEE